MRAFPLFAKGTVTFMSVWLVSSVGMSNGSVAPELPLLAQAKTSAEYPILRRLQDLTLDLQLLELTIKNRRDEASERKISAALKEIENQGAALGDKFKAVRTSQIEAIYGMFMSARRYGRMLGIADAEWDELMAALKEGAITSGPLAVHGRAGALSLLTLSPLRMGKQIVWHISLPEFDRKSFWAQAKSRSAALEVTGHRAISKTAIEGRVAEINALFSDAEKRSKEYFTDSYAKLYAAFETHRYAILQRVQMARKALQDLERHNTAMGTPEEFSSLYNQVLDNLFSYGVDISISGPQRDFAVKGFLFAESPERSQDMLKKLKFTPSGMSYNPPST